MIIQFICFHRLLLPGILPVFSCHQAGSVSCLLYCFDNCFWISLSFYRHRICKQADGTTVNSFYFLHCLFYACAAGTAAHSCYVIFIQFIHPLIKLLSCASHILCLHYILNTFLLCFISKAIIRTYSHTIFQIENFYVFISLIS